MEIWGLANKVALVTGASSGLGKASALAFAKFGAKVVLADIDSDSGEQTAQRIGEIPAYVASKHAIVGLTKTAALEYARSGIRVNVICPGAIDTPFRKRLVKGVNKKELESGCRYPIGRIGKPIEVANTVVWLCSEAASYITGSVVTIDGGLTAK